MTKSLFDIDLNRLDQEWVRQPELYFTHAKELADAKLEQERLKATLDVIKSDLDAEIREKPEKFQINKITENVVSTTITRHHKYKEALNKVIESKHQVDLLTAVTTALEHKKHALQNLVSLHGQNYFSTPVAKTEDQRASLEERLKMLARRKASRRRDS